MIIVALVTHTFRELIARVTILILAGISTLIIIGTLLAISLQADAEGLRLLVFGNSVSPPLTIDALTELVMQLQVSLADGLYAGIIIFGVIATAGLIPDALEKGIADLYLSKPMHRWEFLVGRCLGAVSVMLLNILYFIGSLWLIFGVKIGVWNTPFLLSAFTLGFAFTCLYSLVILLGIVFRGTAIPILAAFFYLFLFGGLLEEREQTLYLISTNSLYRGVIEGLYYLLPQVSAVSKHVTQQIMNQAMDWKPFVQAGLSSGLLFMGGAVLLHRRDF